MVCTMCTGRQKKKRVIVPSTYDTHLGHQESCDCSNFGIIFPGHLHCPPSSRGTNVPGTCTQLNTHTSPVQVKATVRGGHGKLLRPNISVPGTTAPVQQLNVAYGFSPLRIAKVDSTSMDKPKGQIKLWE